jgi:ankyrin repeat protein
MNKFKFKGNLRVFQSLVQAGANRFATDRDRLGILHCAASHGHFQIIQAMLELGHTWVVNAKVNKDNGFALQ